PQQSRREFGFRDFGGDTEKPDGPFAVEDRSGVLRDLGTPDFGRLSQHLRMQASCRAALGGISLEESLCHAP
ncbi:MAG: hypothetical protein ACK56I_36545, partial [bacterium]